MIETLSIGLIIAVFSLVLWIGISMAVRGLSRLISRNKKPSRTLLGLPSGVWFAASLLSALTLGQQATAPGASGVARATMDVGVTIFILVVITLFVRLCIRLVRWVSQRSSTTPEQQQR